jgi:cystathionine beta-lyase
VTELRADPLSQLRNRTSVKWQQYPDDVLPLWVAEMDFPLAEPIAARLHELISNSDTGYVGGVGALAPAFADFALQRWHWALDPAMVRTTTDVSVAIVESLRQVISAGDGVVVTPPVYPPFYDLIPEAGGVVVTVPLLLDSTGAHALDLEGLENAFAAGATAFLLCNPHNPLGLVHSREALVRVAALAAQYGVTVVSDEIHGPLTHSGVEFVPFLSVSAEAGEWGICVTSASKAWNLAGLKCALMVAGSKRGVAAFDRMPVEVGFRTSLFGLHASTAAFSLSVDWLDDALELITANSELLAQLVSEKLPEVRYHRPKASYLAWLDVSALGWGEDPSKVALNNARVALNPGPSFGPEGNGFVRLNFGCSPEVLSEAIDRLGAVTRNPW